MYMYSIVNKTVFVDFWARSATIASISTTPTAAKAWCSGQVHLLVHF